MYSCESGLGRVGLMGCEPARYYWQLEVTAIFAYILQPPAQSKNRKDGFLTASHSHTRDHR